MAPNLTGITIRHSRDCATAKGRKRCDCSPTYRVRIEHNGRRTSETFPTVAAAIAYRDESKRRARRGLDPAPSRTVGDALDDLVANLESGRAVNRSGDPFKPSVVHGYVQAIETSLRPALGGRLVKTPVASLTRKEIQALVNEFKTATPRRRGGRALSPSSIRNRLMPLRVAIREEIANMTIDHDPFTGVRLPTVRGTRDRVAADHEAARLLAVLDDPERAYFAVAIYAGLRRSEVSALRWEDVDLATRRVHVRSSYCHRTRQITFPKSPAAVRSVPITETLVAILDVYRARLAADEGAERIAPTEYVFAAAPGSPLGGDAVSKRARKVWAARDLTPITLHECRHTFASLTAASGTGLEDLSEWMGHTSLNLTWKTYRHLYPEAAEATRLRLDAYLAPSTIELRGLTRTIEDSLHRNSAPPRSV